MSNYNDYLIEQFGNLRNNHQFISIHEYENAYGEISSYNISFHVSYKSKLKKSIEILNKYSPENILEAQARIELIDSYNKSIDKIELNEFDIVGDAYSRVKDFNGKFIPGIKIHKETGNLHLWGYILGKKVLIKGKYKNVNSKPLTLAKKKLEKLTPMSKFRQFKIVEKNFDRIKCDGILISG
jgi:hypothetical protein